MGRNGSSNGDGFDEEGLVAGFFADFGLTFLEFLYSP